MSDDDDFDERPYLDEIRDDFINEFLHLEDILNAPEQLPEVVGFFIAGIQISYQSFLSAFVNDRHRDSICTYRHCRAGVSEPEPEFSVSPASKGIKLSRDMGPWEREEQRKFFKNLRLSSDPERRKLWFKVIDTYRDYFLADYQRSRQTTEFGEPGCSRWGTLAERTEEGVPGNSRDQYSAQQVDLDESSRDPFPVQLFEFDQPGSSRDQVIAQEFDSGTPGSPRDRFSAQQLDLDPPGSSRDHSYAQPFITGLPATSSGPSFSQQYSTGQAGSSRDQSSAQQFASEWPLTSVGPFSQQYGTGQPESSRDACQPGSSRGLQSSESQRSGAWHELHQERIRSAAASSARLVEEAESTYSALGDDALVESLERAVRSMHTSSDRGVEARDYGREITSERWRGNIQRVASAETPSLRPVSRTAPEVSLSSDLVIRPNDILTPEERERMLDSNDDNREYHLKLDKKGRKVEDKCSRWLSSQGINPSSWGQPGPSSSSSYSSSRTTKPGERKRPKEPDPKDQPGPSGVLTAKRPKTPSKGTSPGDDSDPKPSDDSE